MRHTGRLFTRSNEDHSYNHKLAMSVLLRMRWKNSLTKKLSSRAAMGITPSCVFTSAHRASTSQNMPKSSCTA